jgi:hypothetical protein
VLSYKCVVLGIIVFREGLLGGIVLSYAYTFKGMVCLSICIYVLPGGSHCDTHGGRAPFDRALPWCNWCRG